MPQTITGVVKRNPDEIRLTELTPQRHEIAPTASLTEKKEEKEKKTENITDDLPSSPPPLPKELLRLNQKEPAFFSEPKKVKKKNEGSILGFQILTSLIFCLILLLSRMGAPQLYDNLHLFLTRIFL